MNLDEAKAFVITGIYYYIGLALAMNRDAMSGGFIRLVNITKDQVIREVVNKENIPYQM